MAAGFQVIDSGSTDRTITGFQVIDGGGTDRTIVEGRVIGPDRGDRVFWDTSGGSSFSATASPTAIHGSSATGTIITGSTTVTVTGGTPPYSHSWAVDSYTNGTAPTVDSPSAASTSVTQTNMVAGNFESATIVDTVTDSATPPNVTTAAVGCLFHDTSTL